MSNQTETRKQFLTRAGAFIFCLAAAWGHVLILLSVQFPPGTIAWALPLLLAAPGIITMAITRSWKRWYRWAAVLGLAYTTVPSVLAMVIVVAETWALHRSWVVERQTPLRELLRLKRPADKTTTKTKPAKPETPEQAAAEPEAAPEAQTAA